MSKGLSQNLACEFRRKIETGQWPSGERLPTTRELAAKYRVSVNTIRFHVKHMLSKAGARRQSELVRSLHETSQLRRPSA